VCARLNNVLRRFGSGWSLFVEAERREALGYAASSFPDPASWLVDEERRANFEVAGAHFENDYWMTLVFLPQPDQADAAGRLLVEREDRHRGRDWRQALAGFRAETDRAFDLLSDVLPALRPLDDGETLTLLHGCVSSRAHPVAVPSTPMYLDGLLADTPLTGGLDPVLGDRHLRSLTILGLPDTSRPGLLDQLNHLGFGYRWTTRFIAMDKTEAGKVLARARRQWFNKRKSITALLRETLYNQPAQLLDNDADNKAADADGAMQALGQDHVAFGYLTTTITVADIDAERVAERIRTIERVVNGLGFTTIRETVNAVEAWLGSLPGHVYANVRQPLVHTLNLARLMPLSSVWAGPRRNDHLDGPPLLVAETSGTTPFRLSTHVGDVGHMLVVGPTGAGKSVLLALLALQFRRYPGAQVYVFDKGGSARATVLAMGGAHRALGLEDETMLAFQPLRDIHRAAERAWALDWITALLAHERVLVTPAVKDMAWSALESLATAPADERTITGLRLLLQSEELRTALTPYSIEGAYGALLDAVEADLALTDLQCFETETLLNQPSVVAPVLTYLFHRLEARFDGRPTLLVIDEAWIFLDHPLFAGRIREWLKTLRKKNVGVVFATQSLADIANSSIAPSIIESCPQRIFLPNDRAAEPQSRIDYRQFGLNERQIELIARAVPKRQYYLQSARGNRLFELGLGPISIALCAASDQTTQQRIDALLAVSGGDFAARFLRDAGLGWAADVLPNFPGDPDQGA